ncbi:MAG: hypothetical protein AB1733_17605 [Thermodesulfobacteriota bacterium]
MNTVQEGQEKRTIRVREFLDDFYSGASDDNLMTKYRLSATGLERFYDMLQDKGILDPDELAVRYNRQMAIEDDWDSFDDVEKSTFICPSCLASHDAMFDICPKCGVSFQETISDESPGYEDPAQDEFLGAVATEDHTEDPDLASLGEHWSAVDKQESAELPHDSESDSEFFGPPAVPETGEFVAGAVVEEPTGDALKGAQVETMIVGAPAPIAPKAGFVDSLDDLEESDLPFASDSQDVVVESAPQRRCQICDNVMEPGVRDIYDHKRCHAALLGAGICMLLVLVGAIALSFFDGYSLARLLVVYSTGMSLLAGSIMAGVGTFMLLAREKVYRCTGCKSICPRG